MLKKTFLPLAPLFSIFLGLGISIGSSHSGEPITPVRKTELNNLVRQDCGSCHGMTLNGGLGSPLHPASLKEHNAQEVAEIILEGVPGTPMPPWKYLLTRSEANWIATTLKEGSIK